MLVSCRSIVKNALNRSDLKNTKFIDTSDNPDSEIMGYLNLIYDKLYQLIVGKKEFYFTTEYIIDIVPNQEAYDLPDDFFKLDGVDCLISGEVSDPLAVWVTLSPFMFVERNNYKYGSYGNTMYPGNLSRYQLVKNKIKFAPSPLASGKAKLWYTPNPTVITSLDDQIEVVVGGAQYMTLYLAIYMLDKEESDYTALANDLADCYNALKVTLGERDSGSPKYVADVRYRNSGLPFGRVGY